MNTDSTCFEAPRIGELAPPSRLLLGPGPSLVHSRVLRAMASPLIGHLDPAFLDLMGEVQSLLRWVFQTANPFTIAVSGTGSAAMEAVFVNLLEPGDQVVIGVNGIFGSRMADVAERCGARPIRIEAPWGESIHPDAVQQALEQAGPVKAVAVVHAETSTGVHQPLEAIAALCREYDCLFIVDAVTSLGGVPLDVDAWGIDACYSATQKCLSCPPGLSPLTLNERALSVMRARKSPCQSWYLDLSLVADYWEASKRTYHHTAPISMLYALREALRLIQEEGLGERFARHVQNSRALIAGLETLGLTPHAAQGYRLPTLTCVDLPPHVDDRLVRATLLSRAHIEIGGGLGPLAGKVWRIGLMGESSKAEHVMALLTALEKLFAEQAWVDQPGGALKAALEQYETVPILG